MTVVRPRYFGLTPPVLLFVVAGGAVVLALLLAFLGHWLAALVLAVVGLALIGLYVLTEPDNSPSGKVRERTRWALEELSTRARTDALLKKLAQEAVYLEEQGLPERAAERRREMEAIAHNAARRVEDGRFSVQATMIERPQSIEGPVPVPEPGPPPDEGTPPAPPLIPEPGPPPDEGTPPQPDPVPPPQH